MKTGLRPDSAPAHAPGRAEIPMGFTTIHNIAPRPGSLIAAPMLMVHPKSGHTSIMFGSPGFGSGFVASAPGLSTELEERIARMADAAVHKSPAPQRPEAAVVAALGLRSLVLVGMMGAGKSSIGRRLASRLGLPFVDADAEIETAAGMSIPDIFAIQGEPYFRAGEA